MEDGIWNMEHGVEFEYGLWTMDWTLVDCGEREISRIPYRLMDGWMNDG